MVVIHHIKLKTRSPLNLHGNSYDLALKLHHVPSLATIHNPAISQGRWQMATGAFSPLPNRRRVLYYSTATVTDFPPYELYWTKRQKTLEIRRQIRAHKVSIHSRISRSGHAPRRCTSLPCKSACARSSSRYLHTREKKNANLSSEPEPRRSFARVSFRCKAEAPHARTE